MPWQRHIPQRRTESYRSLDHQASAYGSAYCDHRNLAGGEIKVNGDGRSCLILEKVWITEGLRMIISHLRPIRRPQALAHLDTCKWAAWDLPNGSRRSVGESGEV